MLNYIFLAASTEGNSTHQFILIGGILLVFYFFMIRPQQKRQKEQQAFQKRAKSERADIKSERLKTKNVKRVLNSKAKSVNSKYYPEANEVNRRIVNSQISWLQLSELINSKYYTAFQIQRFKIFSQFYKILEYALKNQKC